MALPLTDDFRSIVLEARPLIDLRAPVEYAKGSFPHAVNLPLMNDEERRLIGIRYKEQGNAAAVALGRELIDGAPRAERTAAWKAFVEAHPDAMMFCFRGGQRSRISQEWLAEAGCTIPRLEGGYKAFRRYLMAESERIAAGLETYIVGGRTGSGKTLLLRRIAQSIDLEGLANHRGSSFGRRLEGQPTQIGFENALAYALIEHEAKGYRDLVIEHEGKNVGRVYIPPQVFAGLDRGRLVILEAPIAERTQITFDEYVVSALAEYEARFGSEGRMRWAEDVLAALSRIRKRLGSERYLALKARFEDAFAAHREQGDLEGYKPWIAQLLEEYYDPMYDYQIQKHADRVLFRGEKEAVLDFLTARMEG